MKSGEESGLFVNFAASDEENNETHVRAQNNYRLNNNINNNDNNTKLFSLSTPSNNDHHTPAGPASLVLGSGNRHNNNTGSNNFYSLSSNSNSSEEPTSQSNSSSSYMSLRTKLKAVQEKYRKSSMSDKIKSKFAKPGRGTAGKMSVVDPPGTLDGMSKFLSYSHGALADLDDYPHHHHMTSHHNHSQQQKRRNEPMTAKDQQNTFLSKENDVTTVALVEPPPHSVSSQSSSKSSNFSHPSTPRTRPDFDEMDSGILNEIEEVGSAESLSSGSDSGFYPTGNEDRRNTVRRNNTNKTTVTKPSETSPRCSRCSIHSDGNSSCYEEPKDESEQILAGNSNERQERGRTSRGVTRRHSRASSVDRREIFTKYVARGSEHSVSIHPYASHDPGKSSFY